ncbi:MAG: shikimate dehydrogenase [Alphaproteobacteria bacterium]|nr:shikimate dehydrogenase [Alphaproteobacteria bacterium]
MTSFPLKAAVMGWPISHSLSPRLHGFWLRQYGIDGRYDALPVEPQNLQSALRALPAQGLRGVNLTVPLKELALSVIDTADDTARRIGAVNLVTVEPDGRLHGRNTDAYGFTQNLLHGGYKPDSTAFVLGAGGAARAVIVALADMGFTDIRIANRTVDRAEKLARDFSTPAGSITPVAWHDAADALGGVDLLVNTTSLGMKGQPELAFPLDALPATAAVTDIVYNPLETALLRAARRRGHQTIDGLGMLLHQARPSFAAFFGQDPAVTPQLRDYILADK